MGEIPADLVVKDARLVNVNTAEVENHVDIAVKDGRVALVGDAGHCIGKGTAVTQAQGEYFLPGLLDAHVHVESSMLTLTQFTKAVLPHGTTGVFIDPHEIANVLGLRGIKLFIDESRRLPLKVFVEVPSSVPSAPGLETAGAEIGPGDVVTAMSFRNVVGLAEVMNFPGVLAGDEKVHRKIAAARGAGNVVEGHAPGLLGRELAAYISAGISSDHESFTGEEAVEKLRRGMKLEVREGSSAKNLTALLKPVLKLGLDKRHCLLATDDRHPHDLLIEGHIDHVIRRAIAEGVDLVEAIQMATLNTAEHFGVLELGSISPGKVADMVAVGDLKRFKVGRVFVNGKLAAKNGQVITALPKFTYPKFVRNSVRLKRKLKPQDFVVKTKPVSGRVKARVITVEEGQIITGHEEIQLLVKAGVVMPDLKGDVVRVAVVERHHGTGNVGHGFVRGFGLSEGALASSVGHDAHNITVVGVGPEDMAAAVGEVVESGGGQVVVHRGKTVAELELPIAGLMSDRPVEEVSACVEKLHLSARKLGVKLGSPFMTMAFLSLAVLPKLRITDKGLVDVEKSKRVGPIVESAR
jgi:adenine deaminase